MTRMNRLCGLLCKLLLVTMSVLATVTSGSIGVHVSGTTVGPGYARKAGKLSPSCPESHPFPLDDYRACCSEGGRSPMCGSGNDGDNLLESDSLECCAGAHVACPPGARCKAHHIIFTACPDTWKSLETGCYKVTPVAKTWQGARQECKDSGGYLVEVDNPAEQDVLNSLLLPRSERDYWTGGNDKAKEGSFLWDNSGKLFSFTNWNPSEPSNNAGIEHCVAMSRVYALRWNDVPCDVVLAGLCEMDHLY